LHDIWRRIFRRRAHLQIADIARRLMRGGELHREMPVAS
jgi:hypothetical protein